jgi:NmrA-like family protein
MTITVIGATGRVGGAVVQRLVNAGAAVRVLVRDPEKAKRLFGGGADGPPRDREDQRANAEDLRHGRGERAEQRDDREPSARQQDGSGRVDPFGEPGQAQSRAERNQCERGQVGESERPGPRPAQPARKPRHGAAANPSQPAARTRPSNSPGGATPGPAPSFSSSKP